MVGGLKVRIHRDISEGASLKGCTFTKIGRHWFVTIQADVAVAEAHSLPETIIDLDAGVEHLLTTSTGQHIENPKIGAKQQRKVRRAQRALYRCKKGSKRRAKVRGQLARLQRKTASMRSTYLNQVSASIAKQFAFIGVEKLKVKNMTGSAKGRIKQVDTGCIVCKADFLHCLQG